ncbi:MAG TPA: porin family protein [Chitinophagaceae bacterium]|nr:porin family protein [Chitinophagaceae bacterium]
MVALFFLAGLSVQAQRPLFLENHDNKPYYFGITLSSSSGRLNTSLHPRFLNQDTIMVAEPLSSPGFALGLLATTRLSNRFEGRFNPQLMFTDRSISYKLRYADRDLGTNVLQKVESVIVTLPLQVKFRSDRIGNFRVYLMGGGKVDYDLASNAQARKADDMIKLQKVDYGIEAGVGFNFYFQSFILSPEVKISNGLNDIHARDVNLKYSSVLDRIQSRMIVFSIHIEG